MHHVKKRVGSCNSMATAGWWTVIMGFHAVTQASTFRTLLLSHGSTQPHVSVLTCSLSGKHYGMRDGR